MQFLSTFVVALACAAQPAAPADLVLLNGKIVTVDPALPVAQALAVHGDRIAAVGTNEQIKPSIGPATQVIELGGNDALRGLAPAQLRGNLQRMIALADAADAKVLLLGIDVPPNYGPAYRERLRRVYADLAAGHEGTALVPFFLDGVALQPGMMQADGLHPPMQDEPSRRIGGENRRMRQPEVDGIDPGQAKEGGAESSAIGPPELDQEAQQDVEAGG